MVQTNLVSVRELSVGYRRRGESLRVLDGVSFELSRGELCGLCGPSGSGKTTLLHTLMGLRAPSAGSIQIAAERCGLVFQRSQLFPWRSALENAAYGLECQGHPRREAAQRARDLLGRMGLSEHLQDRPHQLSEGMKQRVNLARALLVEPELLLMDEPFSGLDVLTRRRLQRDLLQFWEARGFTLLFASHSLEEVAMLCDRVLVLSEKPARIKADFPLPPPRPDPDHASGLAQLGKRIAELERSL